MLQQFFHRVQQKVLPAFGHSVEDLRQIKLHITSACATESHGSGELDFLRLHLKVGSEVLRVERAGGALAKARLSKDRQGQALFAFIGLGVEFLDEVIELHTNVTTA